MVRLAIIGLSDYHIVMDSRITATEVARSLSDVLNRVRYRGESFIVDRGGEPVCRIIPAGPTRCSAGDLARVLAALPAPDAAFRKVVAKAAAAEKNLPESPWES